MQLYQHDSSSTFRFVLLGALEGSWVEELEHAWITATSVLRGKELVLDLSGLTGTDENGLDLLSRMRESGARLTAALPPESGEFLRSLGVPAAATSGRRNSAWALRILRLAGLCG